MYFPEFAGWLANVDGRADEFVLNASLPNGPSEIADAELPGKLLSGDDVRGGWKGSLDAVLVGWEVVSGKRFTGSLDPVSNPLPESNPVEGSLVVAGNGSFDAVLVDVPKGSLLVDGDVVLVVPKLLSANSVSEVPIGSSLPNGADAVVDEPSFSEPNSLPVVEG